MKDLAKLANLDKITRDHFPAVMVPKYSPLEKCPMGKTRLLMAVDGLYIETRQPWGILIRRLWDAPRALPYGPVNVIDTFSDALYEAHKILETNLDEAERMAEKCLEWAGWVVWKSGQFSFMPLEYEELSAVKARKIHPRLPEGASLVLDAHSHHRMPAYFSTQDNKDDMGGVKIAQVIGGYTTECGFEQLRTRYCVEGFFFPEDEDFDGDGLIDDDAFEDAI